jgi:lysophospholipase L1-like esterase
MGIESEASVTTLYRLHHGAFLHAEREPAVVVLLIGTNDASAFDPECIPYGVGNITTLILSRFPAAKVVLLSLLPRAAWEEVLILGVNRRLKRLHNGRNVFYLDIFSAFAAPQHADFAARHPVDLAGASDWSDRDSSLSVPDALYRMSSLLHANTDYVERVIGFNHPVMQLVSNQANVLRGELFSDGLHLTTAGYQLLAKLIVTLIKDLLPQPGRSH